MKVTLVLLSIRLFVVLSMNIDKMKNLKMMSMNFGIMSGVYDALHE